MRFLRAFAYGSDLVLSSAFPCHFSLRVSVAYSEDGRSGLFRNVGVHYQTTRHITVEDLLSSLGATTSIVEYFGLLCI
jgi:hypothetical protein